MTTDGDEVVLARDGWMPRVVRSEADLSLAIVGGADALHDPREFSIPITADHLEVLREDLARHLLLWSALSPLCDAAGTRGPLDQAAATALLDPILFGSSPELDALFRSIPWDRRLLVAHHATIGLLQRGRMIAALRHATETAAWDRVAAYDADRDRRRRGVRLTPLDTAVLRYTGQHVHRATIPVRKPEAVPRQLLPQVLRVIAVAEGARGDTRFEQDWRPGEHTLARKREWQQLQEAVEIAVRRAFPELADDAVGSVSFLICSETAREAREASDG